MIHFLTSLTQDKELFSMILISFFNEVDTRSNYPRTLVSFFNEVDTRNKPSLDPCSWAIREHDSKEIFTGGKNHAVGGIHVIGHQ